MIFPVSSSLIPISLSWQLHKLLGWEDLTAHVNCLLMRAVCMEMQLSLDSLHTFTFSRSATLISVTMYLSLGRHDSFSNESQLLLTRYNITHASIRKRIVTSLTGYSRTQSNSSSEKNVSHFCNPKLLPI